LSLINIGVIYIQKNGNIKYCDPFSKSLLELEEKSSIFDKLSNKEISDFILSEVDKNTSEIKEFSFNQNNNCKVLSVKVEKISENDFIINIIDLSKIRKLENLQRDFVANVSHELRTPLTSIKMAAESLQIGAISDEKMKYKFLSNIQREADRLTRLVNELLVLANLDNKVTLHISKFNFSELLNDIVTTMKYHADLNDILLIGDFPENLPFIEADRDRLHQVLINLVDNAIKCNKQNGKVTLYSRLDDNKIIIKVIDTGIGIHKVDIERIFDRFFRVDKSRSRVTGGTGLGLSIVKDIITAHNGKIEVESEVNVGTTFTITLPISKDSKD
jgi:two-component system phosphate regulon sensor histidine kinase PhoR